MKASNKRTMAYLLWLISSLLLVAGMVLPMFSFHKFYIFNDTFSLLGSVIYLFGQGEYALFLILVGFSIVMPLYKLVLSFLLVADGIKDNTRKIKIVHRLAMVSKWSMADVLVIAVLVATVKLDMVASIEIHIGLYAFALGVMMSMLLVHLLLSDYELRPMKKV